MFYIDEKKIFLQHILKAFDLIKSFDKISKSNNLFKILYINEFSDSFTNDSLMWLDTLPISINLSKSFSWELILIKLQSSSFSNAFCLLILLVNIFVFMSFMP